MPGPPPRKLATNLAASGPTTLPSPTKTLPSVTTTLPSVTTTLPAGTGLRRAAREPGPKDRGTSERPTGTTAEQAGGGVAWWAPTATGEQPAEAQLRAETSAAGESVTTTGSTTIRVSVPVTRAWSVYDRPASASASASASTSTAGSSGSTIQYQGQLASAYRARLRTRAARSEMGVAPLE